MVYHTDTIQQMIPIAVHLGGLYQQRHDVLNQLFRPHVIPCDPLKLEIHVFSEWWKKHYLFLSLENQTKIVT